MSRREEIAVALNATRALLPENVTLIVVTKTFPVSDVEILYQLGERNFGENRDSEGFSKAEVLPDDVIWHFQGEFRAISCVQSSRGVITSTRLMTLGMQKKSQQLPRNLEKSRSVSSR